MKDSNSRSCNRTRHPYSEQDWDDESYALFGARADPVPCPDCGRTGFYGPRAKDPDEKLRTCRFCGFCQAVDHMPVRFRPVVHGCADWPKCARAPYLWWITPDTTQFLCPYCGQKVEVETRNQFMKGVLVAAPSVDSEHPWQKVPQGRSYSYYLRFWENWDCSKGRTVL